MITVVGTAVGTVVFGVGAGVFVVTIVVGIVVGTGVVAESTVFVAAGVTVVLVAGRGVAPGISVTDGDCWTRRVSLAPAVPDKGAPVICEKCGKRRNAAAPSISIPTMTTAQTCLREPVADPAA
jgi:uncharacterized Rossmann fold enzyme